MDPKYTRTVTVLPSQVDMWGRLSVAHTFDLFMDTATEAAGALGVGWEMLMKKGLFWITVKTRSRFIDPPRLLETVQVDTWPERPGELRCDRSYMLRRGDETLALGKTEWAIVNMKDRAPQRLADILPPDLEYPGSPLLPEPFPMIGGDFGEAPFHAHRVCATDIDMARHMNNVAYVRALLDGFSTKEWQGLNVKQLDVIFLNSAREGETLSFQKRREGDLLDIRGTLPDGRASVLARLTCK